MSKKIQEKKAKKPRPERVTLASLNRKIDLLDSRLRTLKAWETMQDAMEESRSAPAEEWVPKVGDWVWNDVRGIGRALYQSGPHFAVTFPGYHAGWKAETGEERCWYMDTFDMRPANQKEIASHKAKEEQRAKEEEWAKYDVLQEGDACRCSYDKACRLAQKAMDGGVPTCWPGKDASGVYFTSSGYVHQANSRFIEAQTYPEDEWERRLQGTISKRAEEERAKELAKPLLICKTLVRYAGHDGVYLGPHGNQYEIASPNGTGTWTISVCERHEFTVID